MQELTALIESVATTAKHTHTILATAESCTGGLIAASLTELSGSSEWFDRGFVTYSNEAKQGLLDVDLQLIESHGAVSEQVVKAMALGALNNSLATCSVAVSGIAGPTGGTADKPVGTVWIAWGEKKSMTVSAQCYLFKGGRSSIRQQAAQAALEGILSLLEAR